MDDVMTKKSTYWEILQESLRVVKANSSPYGMDFRALFVKNMKMIILLTNSECRSLSRHHLCNFSSEVFLPNTCE